MTSLQCHYQSGNLRSCETNRPSKRHDMVFCHKTWNIIGKPLCNMVRCYFSLGHLLKTRHTILLLLKLATQLVVIIIGLFSLSNISYKIISKILANRLKRLLLKIVSPLQGTLIQGRDIHNNIQVAHEILNSFSKNRKTMD